LQLEVSNDNFVRIRGLSVTYSPTNGDVVRALDDVSLEIRAGEVLGILGESGCGKSTLANAMLKLLPSHAKVEGGEIVFHGRDLLRLTEPELRNIRGRKISLVPQDPALSLNPVITVGTQIAEVLRAHLRSTSKERRDRVHELLREVGFDQPAAICNAYPHQLSGGQRQRVVIAQALACRPALLIADEPTSKLDPQLCAEIVDLLSRMRVSHGTAMLVISHDPALVAALADRVALMYAGQIVEDGKCSEILRRPFHPYTQGLVQIARSTMAASGSVKRHLPRIEGEPPDPTAVPVGCRFEPRCPDRMEMCGKRHPREIAPEPMRSVSCFKYGE
jgi:oligopeptide/dipeptide ABC transporter ATP-binding protein